MSLIILAGVVAAVIIIVFLCSLWSGMGNPVVKFLYLIVNVFVLVLVIRFRDLIPEKLFLPAVIFCAVTLLLGLLAKSESRRISDKVDRKLDKRIRK